VNDGWFQVVGGIEFNELRAIQQEIDESL